MRFTEPPCEATPYRLGWHPRADMVENPLQLQYTGPESAGQLLSVALPGHGERKVRAPQSRVPGNAWGV